MNGQAVSQIRPQVNISQQQRLPAANASRLPQQMLQVQAAQQRVLAAANANMNATGPNTPHLSPGFAQRATAPSPVAPHSSPPQTSTTPNPPRPSSASQHPGHAQPSPNLAHAAATRQNPNPGIYYASMHGVQFTQEQMEQAMRIQQSLMVSGHPSLHRRPKTSTAPTHDDAGLRPSGTGTGRGATSSGAGLGTSAGSGTSASAGTGSSADSRSTDGNIPTTPVSKLIDISMHSYIISSYLIVTYMHCCPSSPFRSEM